jgi:hypothetical protein
MLQPRSKTPKQVLKACFYFNIRHMLSSKVVQTFYENFGFIKVIIRNTLILLVYISSNPSPVIYNFRNIDVTPDKFTRYYFHAIFCI